MLLSRSTSANTDRHPESIHGVFGEVSKGRQAPTSGINDLGVGVPSWWLSSVSKVCSCEVLHMLGDETDALPCCSPCLPPLGDQQRLELRPTIDISMLGRRKEQWGSHAHDGHTLLSRLGSCWGSRLMVLAICLADVLHMSGVDPPVQRPGMLSGRSAMMLNWIGTMLNCMASRILCRSCSESLIQSRKKEHTDIGKPCSNLLRGRITCRACSSVSH